MTPLPWWIPALLSAAAFAAMAACVRMASDGLPQEEVVFFRNAMALIFLLPMLVRRRIGLATRRFPLHLLRATSGLAAMYLYFYAIRKLPLADAVLLNYTSPLFVALFALLWLGEEPAARRMTALLLGAVGVGFLFTPSSASFSFAGLCGLMSGVLAGLALATVKRLSDSEPPLRIVAWFAILATLISAMPAAVHFVVPKGEQWGWLLGLGLFGNIGQIGLADAYRRAPASLVSPLGYTSLLFAAFLGLLFWDEVLSLTECFGAAMVASAGILVARERREPLPEPPSGVPPYTEGKRN